MHSILVINEKYRTRKTRSFAKLSSTFRNGRQEFSLGDFHWFAQSDLVRESQDNYDVAFIGAALLAMSKNIEFECDLPVTEGCVAAVQRLFYALRLWRPRKIYFPPFHATNVVGNKPATNQSGGLCISGGLDSTFSAFMNSKTRSCNFGILTIGGDYDGLDDPRFGPLRTRARKLCERFELEYAEIKYAPAFRHAVNWKMFHVATLWMLQRFLQPSISKGAVSADYTFVSELAYFPWGNCAAIISTLDDPSFEFSHVGREYQRFEKMAKLVREAPDIIPNIIVCARPDVEGRNCGNCKKCIRTQLNLEVAGHPMPELFNAQPDLVAWLKARRPYRTQLSLRRELAWALEHEANLPKGPLKDAASAYCLKIERALIPRGRI